jgi:hypothetical protein
LGQDEGFELFDAGDLTAGLHSVGTLQPGSQQAAESCNEMLFLVIRKITWLRKQYFGF